LIILLWIVGLVGLAWAYGSYFVQSYDVYWEGFAVVIVAGLVETELVYEDAKAINKLKGAKVLDATLWSLVAFLLFEIAVPWYVFSRRKSAISS
jgi:hypothetical protein